MFVIVWGFRVRLSTHRELTFACPRCSTDRHGRFGVARRWFTLFWVPLVPLGVLGDIVRCETCKGTFDPAVLRRPTNAALMEAIPEAVRLLAVAVLRGADAVPSGAHEAAVAFVAQARPGYHAERLDADLAGAELTPLPAALGPLAAGMTLEGKEHLLAGLTRLAAACGSVTDQQRLTLHAAGRALGMTALHVDGVLAVSGAGQPAGRDDLPPSG